MGAFFLLILLGAVFGGTIASMSRRDPVTPNRNATQKPSPISRLPALRRNDLFSATERSVYEMLRKLTPNHTIFAKVRLADLVSVDGAAATHAHLDRIDRKHIDFVVCDRNLAPVVAIALDDVTLNRSNRSEHKHLIDEVLAAAAMPVVHVRKQHHYLMDELHRLLAPYLRIGTLIL